MSLSRDYYTIVVCGADSKPTTRKGETFFLVSGQEYSVMIFNHNSKWWSDIEVFVAGKLRDSFVLSPENGVKLQGQFNSPCEIAFICHMNEEPSPAPRSNSWWWNIWNRREEKQVEPLMIVLTLAAIGEKK